MRGQSLFRHFAVTALLMLAAWCAFAPARSSAQGPPNVFNLADFGAVGDGTTDDGPALQSALDAAAAAGGGTIEVPAGRFAIITPVSKDFGGSGSLVIRGVESTTPVPPPTAFGDQLSKPLDLVSEFHPQTGPDHIAVRVSGLESFLVKDIAFVGTPSVQTDAYITLDIVDVGQATVRHCEFYGLISQMQGGSIVSAVRSRLAIEQTKFLGSTGNSGVMVPTVQCLEWKDIRVENSIFIDYGQRPELFSKTGMAAAYSWLIIGNAAEVTPDSPRREVTLREVFFDEGALAGLSALPSIYPPTSAPIDLLYVTGLYQNVANLGTSGHYLTDVSGVLIEKSHYGWSQRADVAINLLNIGNAILDEIDCTEDADRLRADNRTGRLTVINSVYANLDSQAHFTDVRQTATPDEDPVQYVRQRFVTAAGRVPDGAAHFYWSDLLLRCGADATCLTSKRAALEAYLASSPAQRFAVEGRITDEEGDAMPGVAVALTGSQTVATQTDAQGRYRFSGLPTSGVYTVTPALRHHSFGPSASRTLTTPAGDVTADFAATFNHHNIRGRVADGTGSALSGVTVRLTGSATATVTTGDDGTYAFDGLLAGGNYTVTPSRTSYAFAPFAQTFNDLDANRTLDFRGTFGAYAINGNVNSAGNAAPIGGVTITLSGGANRTTTTDSSGNYIFTGLPSGLNYTVTPSLLGHSFAPPSQTFAALDANRYAGFTATFTTHTVNGRVTNASGGAGVAGATVALSGHSNATTTTDANGNYSFAGLLRGANYTVTVSRANYTFAQPSRTFNNISSNQTADFAGTLVNYTVSGRVTLSGANFSGVVVTLSGSQSAQKTTDSNGNYSFTLPAEGNYTLTPSKANYNFAPQSISLNKLGGNQTADFAAALNRHTVAGRVVNVNNTGVPGILLTLSGAQGATATTGADGGYSFTGLAAGGNYTVTPSLRHHSFAPASKTFSALSSDQDASFNITLNTHKISGRVTNAGGAALAGATLSLSGSHTFTTTSDANGNYSFAGLPAGGNYAVAVAKDRYTFATSARTFNDLDSDKTADFGGTLVNYTVSGRVTSGGAGLAGVTVALSGSASRTTTTDANGNYSFNVEASGNYTVTPSKTHYTFAPPQLSFNDLGGNRTADFAATLNRHMVAGRVVNVNGGAMPGVLVTLSGAQGATTTTTTDANGDFAFPNLAAGASYAVTPTLRNHTFTPPSRTYDDLASDRRGDFAGGLSLYQIGGRVTEKGAGLAGVTMTISAAGAQVAQTTTDAVGKYSFRVIAENSYTVTPSKQNYTFDRAGATFNNLSGDQTADFAATLRPVVEFSMASASVSEGVGVFEVTVTRGGDTSGELTITYAATDGTARQGLDLGTVVGQITFAPGQTTQTITIFVTDDGYVEGPETVTLRLTDAGGALLGSRPTTALTIQDNDQGAPDANPVDDAQFFVRQHYRDFLNREPDAEGLAFWTEEITSCGADDACVAVKRENVSAAFFLSIEFKETGYLVYRMYKAAYGRMPRRVEEFLLDAGLISGGVAVGKQGWEAQLEANREALLGEFVARPAFAARYPSALTPAQFVSQLNANTGSALTAEEVAALASSSFGGAADSSDPAARRAALRKVAENAEFSRRELNRAFVLMQYFGYLQRNPDDPPDDSRLIGYNFWLKKLDDNQGNFVQAQMVKAFIDSIEYRDRFGR